MAGRPHLEAHLRDLELIANARAGATRNELALAFGTTHQNVSRILKRHGVELPRANARATNRA